MRSLFSSWKFLAVFLGIIALLATVSLLSVLRTEKQDLQAVIIPDSPAKCISATATPTTIALGGSVTLQWTTEDADDVLIRDVNRQERVGLFPPNSSTTVTPTQQSLSNGEAKYRILSRSESRIGTICDVIVPVTVGSDPNSCQVLANPQGPAVAVVGQEVQFLGRRSSTGSCVAGFHFEWNIPDATYQQGTSSTSKDPFVIFNSSGTKTITLIVRRDNVSDTKQISVLASTSGGGGSGSCTNEIIQGGNCAVTEGNILVCAKPNQTFHVSTAECPILNYDIPVPSGQNYKKIIVDLDVTPGPWWSGEPAASGDRESGYHSIFWLQRGGQGSLFVWPDNLMGYVVARGPQQNKVVANVQVDGAQTQHLGGNFTFQQGNTYHVRYIYDTENPKKQLTVTSQGQTVVDVQDSLVTDSIRYRENGFFISFGSNLARHTGPEVPTIGWRYSNLRMEFYPGGTSPPDESDFCSEQTTCNVWKKDSADPTCRAQTYTVMPGETCRLSGTVQNSEVIWARGYGPPASRENLATLKIEGPCTSNIPDVSDLQNIVFPGCSEKSFDVTCTSGVVTFSTNDSSFLEVANSCNPLQCAQNSDCTGTFCVNQQVCQPTCTSNSCVASTNCQTVPGQCGAPITGGGNVECTTFNPTKNTYKDNEIPGFTWTTSQGTHHIKIFGQNAPEGTLPKDGNASLSGTLSPGTYVYSMKTFGADNAEGTSCSPKTITVENSGGTGGSLSCTLTASNTAVHLGQSVSLIWTTNNASSASIVPDIGAPMPFVLPAGSHTFTPQSTQTYIMTVNGQNGTSSSCSVSITVNPPLECTTNSDCTENLCTGNQLCEPVCRNNQCVAGTSCTKAIGQCGVQCTDADVSQCDNVCVDGQVCEPACGPEGQCRAGTNCNTIVGQCGVVNPLSASVPIQTVLVGQKPLEITLSGGTPEYSIGSVDDGGTGLTASLSPHSQVIHFLNSATGSGTMVITVQDASGNTLDISVIVLARFDLASIERFEIESPCDGQTKVVGEYCTLTATVTYRNGQVRDVSRIVSWEGWEEIGEFVDGDESGRPSGKSDLKIIPREVSTDAMTTANVKALLPIDPGDPITWIRNGDDPINISVMDPERLLSFSISTATPSCANNQLKVIGENCVLRATGTFEDGTTHDITSLVRWEGFEAIGEIEDAVLKITKREPRPRTTAEISATFEQPESSPYPNVVSRNVLSISVGEKVPHIQSVFTVGNPWIERGTTETLYIRVVSELGADAFKGEPIEAWLIEGNFPSPASIHNEERFQITKTGLPDTVTTEKEDENGISVLIELPVFIPVFETMDDGPFTFLVNVHTDSGNVISAVAPTRLGVPPSGDVNGNGRLELFDIILMFRMSNGRITPSAEEIKRADFNGNGKIDLVDVIYALRKLSS